CRVLGIAWRAACRYRLSLARAIPFGPSPRTQDAFVAWRRDRRRPRSLRSATGHVRAVLLAGASRGNRRCACACGARRMSAFNQVLFDIGGVLGSNGWDREQRAVAVEKFALDGEDFQYRHEETVGAFESGEISLEEYLDLTVFWRQRDFSREEFKRFMFSLSAPWAESLEVVRRLRQAIRGRPTRVRMATLNNESRELNEYRIRHFGLCELFDVFFSSCW